MSGGHNMRVYADITSLLTKAPRTVKEIQQLSGVSEMSARRWLHALADEGVLRFETRSRDGYRGGRPEMRFHWNRDV